MIGGEGEGKGVESGVGGTGGRPRTAGPLGFDRIKFSPMLPSTAVRSQNSSR